MIEELLADPVLRTAAIVARPDDDPRATVARVAWGVIAEPGDGVAGALIAQCGAESALQLALAPDDGSLVSAELAEGRRRWTPRAELRSVRDALQGAREVGARLLLPGDENWPSGIDDLGAHAPVLLWARGDIDTLAAPSRVAIVGARAATAYGDTVAADLAGDLAAGGTLIVSGGAYGIDGSAHRAALGVGGATVAVLAGGVDRLYPAGHAQLFNRIMAAGVLLSEVPCGAAPTKWRFLARNRSIAALGQATVVVEAGWRSGSLNTAGHAASLGRPLGAVPGPVTSAASAGCHRLLREYDAQCVTTAAEVRELMGEPETGPVASFRADPDLVRVRDALSSRTPLAPVEIARRSGLSIERVRALLGMLAIGGEAEASGAGWVRAKG